MRRATATCAILLMMSVLAALAGCAQQGTSGDGAETLRMMGNQNMAFLDVVNGQPTGFSADLAAEIAKRIDRGLEVTLQPFPELFPRLAAGECDIAMSAITITPERLAEVDFSDPYFSSGQAILVPLASSIYTTSDLSGKTVGVLKDSTNQQEAETIGGIGKIVTFDAKEPMFAALVDGKLDAVICDTPFAKYNVIQTGKTRLAKAISAGDEYGIALKKGNTELLGQIDEALASIREDGTYERLYNKYFGH